MRSAISNSTVRLPSREMMEPGDDFAGEFEAGVGKFGFACLQFGDGEVVQRHFFRAVHDHGEQAGDNDGKSRDEFYFFGGHFNLCKKSIRRWTQMERR